MTTGLFVALTKIDAAFKRKERAILASFGKSAKSLSGGQISQEDILDWRKVLEFFRGQSAIGGKAGLNRAAAKATKYINDFHKYNDEILALCKWRAAKYKEAMGRGLVEMLLYETN